MSSNTISGFTCYLALILIGIVLPFVIHLVLVRFLGLFRKPGRRQNGAVWAIALGFIATFSLFCFWFLFWGESCRWPSGWTVLYTLLIYTLFAYVYFHFFNMGETARRIRLLTRLPRTEMTQSTEIIRDYTTHQMLALRLNRLEALGELRLEGNRYFVARGILVLPAKIVFALRKLIFPTIS